MLASWIKVEVKNLLGNKMTVMMIFYPFVLGGIGRYVIVNELAPIEAMRLVAIYLALIVGFIYGSMAGFSLLDDRDDQVFASIQISPVPLNLYIWFKVSFAFVLSVLSSFFVIWSTGAFTLSWPNLLLVSILTAMQTPITAFLVNAFANNKVEGFVTMKATKFLLMFPAGGFFFLDAYEWLFAIAPPHWAAKALQYHLLESHIEAGLVSMNLDFYQYIFIGIAYNLFLIALTFKLFKQKNYLNC